MMDVNNNADLWNRLENIILEYRTLGKDDAAVRSKLNIESSDILIKIYPILVSDDFSRASERSSMDALGTVWLEALDKFNPEKGKLSAFFSSRLNLRKRDINNKDAGYRKQSQNDNGEQNEWTRNISLDEPIPEDKSRSIGDTIPAGDEDVQLKIELEDTVYETIALILNLPERLNGRAKNPERINYFRLFFTDSMVNVIHSCGMNGAHERDIFEAMKRSFLDYFLSEQCFTIKDIERTDLKLYGEMVSGRPMVQPDHPLPNDVYVTYLNTLEGMSIKSESTITNQRNAYKKFLIENLQQ